MIINDNDIKESGVNKGEPLSANLQDASKNASGEKDGKSDVARMGDGYTLAIHFVLSILICAGFGYWLDSIWATKPWFMLVFLVLGFASALWKIYQQMALDED